MTIVRKILFGVDVLCAVGLVPVVIVAYSLTSMRIGVDTCGIIDNVAFVLVFQLVVALINRAGAPRLVRPLRLLWTAFVATFFVANVIYYRFFNTWIPLDAVRHWREVTTIHESIYEIFRAKDVVIGFFVPVALAGIVPNRALRLGRLTMWIMTLCVLLLFLLHARLASDYINLSQVNPLFDFPRTAMREWIERQNTEEDLLQFQSRSDEFRPMNRSLYRRTNNFRYPLEEIPIHRRPAPRSSDAPNVVFILVESLRAYESGTYGAVPSHTPNFDRLAAQGLIFKDFYANGSYTIKGEFASLCSMLPDVWGSHVYIDFVNHGFDSLPSHLRAHGYGTHWISGLEANFGAARAFLMNHGIEQIHDSIPHPKKIVMLGPSDEDVFAYAADVLSHAPEPFFSEILTLSSHFPFDAYGAGVAKAPLSVDERRSYGNYARGLEYADQALGQFLTHASQTAWGRKTIFVITGDHGLWIFPDGNKFDRVAKDEIYFRLPFLIWSPRLIRSGVNSQLGSQIDIAPTVLDLLGIYEKNSFLGVSLLRNDVEARCAFLLQDGRWSMRRGDAYMYDAGEEGFLEHFPFVTQLAASDPHVGFHTATDLLLHPDPKVRRALSRKEKSELENFGQDSLDVYSGLLHADCVFQKESDPPGAPSIFSY